MLFDFRELSGADGYKLLSSTVVPRPIAWITSRGGDGVVNAAPYSFFNALAGAPPVVGIGISSRPDGSRKDSGRNILREKEFVVNLVSAANAEAMNVTAIDFPHGTSELAQAGLHIEPGVRIGTPRLAESPVALECNLLQTVDLGPERLIVLGEVLAIHVRDDAVISREKCYIDAAKLDLIGRMHGGGWYARTTDRFELPRIPLDQWEMR